MLSLFAVLFACVGSVGCPVEAYLNALCAACSRLRATLVLRISFCLRLSLHPHNTTYHLPPTTTSHSNDNNKMAATIHRSTRWQRAKAACRRSWARLALPRPRSAAPQPTAHARQHLAEYLSPRPPAPVPMCAVPGYGDVPAADESPTFRLFEERAAEQAALLREMPGFWRPAGRVEGVEGGVAERRGQRLLRVEMMRSWMCQPVTAVPAPIAMPCPS
ncbi:hypothetical protein CC86DRAFT_461914 [Ophiobolus disseminans]|uniref:Uncharacterized protein n=1 Tax=Ophiobolus disseminans TaxID=1469910 RepID=A0A6A7ALI3_9PLEO|nr:hypothetical protein CC86DRAFT_461914 [Ophiobolus disseminans]